MLSKSSYLRDGFAKTMIRQLAEASAASSNDVVSVVGTFLVPQDFISGINFTLADFWIQR
jgi:hypothetical protein